MWEDLKQLRFEKGQIWWFIENNHIRKCQYLCEFPFNNPANLGTYDIVIWKDTDEPVRIYRKTLVDKIEKFKHILTYEDACKEVIRLAEENVNLLRRLHLDDPNKSTESTEP